ncbi:unnamed protein product [Prorocentrum cordatum]|uniref:MACPF domain-containing protein n=1 Tax=Prorocentrum cordatum TaxID=2364126 RepID=A0ABN9TX71_9DINO|nr:unnamed protein product [Polarella glacialis]
MTSARPGCPSAATVAWAIVSCAALVEGGLKTRSASGCGATEPRRLTTGALSKGSGLEYMASGYDIFFGNPDPTNGAVDAGFRSQVFKLNPGSETTPDGSNKVPEGMSTLNCDGSCSLTSKKQSITSMQDYYDFLSTSVYVDVGFADIASFSASLDFQRVRQGFEDHENVYTTVVAHCCAYEAFIETYKPPPADENFLAAVEMAPVDYEQAFYFEIIGEFGTHFLSSAQLGGMYGEETEFTHDQYNSMKAAKSDWWMAAQASFVVSVDAGMASQSDWMSKEFFDKYSTTTRKYSLGSMPPQGGDPEVWLSQTMKQPVPTSMKLRPLSQLFTTTMAPNENVTKLEAKRKNMERALQEYCPEKLLKEGIVDSCKTVMSDPDAAAAADDKTCLAKVGGAGGPGGQSFDDSGTMIQLYGLFANVQVSQIVVKSQRWLNSIQLVLSQGDSNWPLPEHGGKSGVHNTLTFSVGQKITAVELRYQRYIDKISFWTNDGSEQHVGGEGGAYSRMVNFQDAVRNATGYLPREAWMVGLYGHSDQYVDSLGFYVAYTCTASQMPGPVGGPASAPNQTSSGAIATNGTTSMNASSSNSSNSSMDERNVTTTTDAAAAAGPLV